MKSNKKIIKFIQPDLPNLSDLRDDYSTIIENNWYTNFGPYEKKFREELEDCFSENISAVPVANATIGLMLAAMALLPDSVRKQVIMPSFTFAAGAEVLILLGFKPVFIDVDPKTWQPNTKDAQTYIQRHKADIAGILFCNIFGVGAPEIEVWEHIAEENRLPLIIDSAAGFGSKYADGSRLGVRGSCEVFSFHATKPFAIGEGGVVLAKSKELADKIRRLSNFGFDSNKEAVEIGLNGKMQELNAVIGIKQLKKLDRNIRHRQEKLAIYKDLLKPQGYEFQENDENSSVSFVSVLSPSGKKAAKFQRRLQLSNIESRNYYNPPLHKHKKIMKSSIVGGQLNITERICNQIVSLPVHKEVTANDISYICSLVK